MTFGHLASGEDSVWSDRAEGYRTSATHMQGDDLDALVEMCEPGEGVKALDVASGGGHVARRLREAGCSVVTVDPAPGMRADVIARAEDLPFADGAFDVVVTRIAAHHFGEIERAIGELERVANRLVVVEDTLYLSEQQEQAETLRDPTHVRSYTEEEWKAMLTAAGLEVEQVEHFEKLHVLDEWLARTRCEGEEAERVKELLAPVSTPDGKAWRDVKILLKARKSQA
jgi:ubiquinone/menaquinone biosynthesis C-methylase UbiE